MHPLTRSIGGPLGANLRHLHSIFQGRRPVGSSKTEIQEPSTKNLQRELVQMPKELSLAEALGPDVVAVQSYT